MKFTNHQRWWTRTRAISSLDGRWLPLLGLGGLIAALVFSAWRFEPFVETVAAGAAASADRPADFQQLPAVRVTLRSDAAGRLAAIDFNGRPIRGAADLRREIKAFIGPANDATVEVELDCDGKLRYDETRRTIDAISSYPSPDGPTTIPLVDRIKFLPRQPQRP